MSTYGIGMGFVSEGTDVVTLQSQLSHSQEKIKSLEEQNRDLKEKLQKANLHIRFSGLNFEKEREELEDALLQAKTDRDNLFERVKALESERSPNEIDYSQDLSALLNSQGVLDEGRVLRMYHESQRMRKNILELKTQLAAATALNTSPLVRDRPKESHRSDVVSEVYDFDDSDNGNEYNPEKSISVHALTDDVEEDDDDGSQVVPKRAAPSDRARVNNFVTEKTAVESFKSVLPPPVLNSQNDGSPVIGGDGVFSALVFDHRSFDFTHQIDLCVKRVRQGASIRTRVVRESAKTFAMYLQSPDAHAAEHVLMYAHMEKTKKRHRVVLSLDPKDFSASSPGYVGAAAYSTIFPDFISFEDCRGRTDLAFAVFLRKNDQFSKHGMIVGLPLEEDGAKPDESLISRFRSGRKEGIFRLVNKVPQWSNESRAFCLNYGGRVSQGSIKNFQLQQHGQSFATAPVLMQFGRTNKKNEFILDFSYPLSPLIAFPLAVYHLHLLT
eukprot:TRINITY_DN12346_c0_g1::TRINITY_DN12346_c0_g1_i1::g.4984::m.4984 TRINITY_DN12346_c0_g1::TRINITY_DN12346_c0_g1_i1::g.4984  ORF type:complete len:498 (+),score=139.26,sp/P46686/TULP2_MOUSE/29.11/2e-19,Tub/PF01167.13/0.11,Tub/PF01167.13/6.9e-23,DUF4349/PF14257.1/0.022,DUF4349/PF14257.1/5e+03,NBP1/PF08537.5/80,NBP1/PF08537.5/0.013,IncA/PF04156.9/0.3,ADIP/PF11559.3/0.22,ADIP/PF11559.3/46,Fez1/PF06818.10/0.5,DUF904/PF06005.7/0.74,DivIC/PF04977.10/0.97,DivIC/PF04977.10/3.9,DivIC/PF04977.10/9.2e+02,CENP-